MNIFGVGPLELLVVLLLAFFLLGPSRMASFGKRFGRMMADLRRVTEDLPGTLEELAEGPEHKPLASTRRASSEPPPAESQPWQQGSPSPTASEPHTEDTQQQREHP